MYSNLADIAYFAGLFDGEGYVGVRRRGVVLRVQMMDAPPIDWLHQTFGGRRYEHSTAAYRGRVCYAWHLATAADVNEILNAAMPYFRVKGDEAQATIAFNDYRRANRLDRRLPTYDSVLVEYERLRHAILSAKLLRASYPIRDSAVSAA